MSNLLSSPIFCLLTPREPALTPAYEAGFLFRTAGGNRPVQRLKALWKDAIPSCPRASARTLSVTGKPNELGRHSRHERRKFIRCRLRRVRGGIN